MGILIVAAHLDDEVLGCGGTAAQLATAGTTVRSCILSGRVDARLVRPSDKELAEQIRRAQEVMGLPEPIVGDFPNIQFGVVPHLDLVRFIEDAIGRTQADIVVTHHHGDLNVDHYHTSIACQAACRLFQRKPGVRRLRGLYFMEVLSSTDWAFAGAAQQFQATTFVEIGKEFLGRKIEALSASGMPPRTRNLTASQRRW